MQNSFFVDFNIDYAEKNIEAINKLKSELNLYKNNNNNTYINMLQCESIAKIINNQ